MLARQTRIRFLRGAFRSTISGASGTNGKKLPPPAAIRANEPGSAATAAKVFDDPQQISGEFNIDRDLRDLTTAELQAYLAMSGAGRDEPSEAEPVHYTGRPNRGPSRAESAGNSMPGIAREGRLTVILPTSAPEQPARSARTR